MKWPAVNFLNSPEKLWPVTKNEMCKVFCRLQCTLTDLPPSLQQPSEEGTGIPWRGRIPIRILYLQISIRCLFHCNTHPVYRSANEDRKAEREAEWD